MRRAALSWRLLLVLVLLGAWHQVGVFPWILTHKGAIEAIIGQKLLVAGLSGFTRVA